ncbi:MAG: hypothetical protein MJ057_02080 [Sphaerochaetaceae bacterium]|nr:hypothetical protein [Sphaerochaetaceae bacterium]
MKLSYLIQITRSMIELSERYLSFLSDKPRIAGHLRISKEKGNTRFYLKNDYSECSGHYLANSEMETIRTLAQQDYEKKLRREVSKTLGVLRKSLSQLETCKDPEEVFTSLSEARKSLVVKSTPAIADAAKWKDRGYYRKHAFSIHDRVIVTRNGLRVRSKTEEIIVNIFEELEIPYIYEYPIVIDGEWVYPDFTVLNTRTGKEYIYEHCGKMDDPDYVERNLLRKLELYAKKGIFEGDNLLLTFETNSHPLNEQYLLSFIRKHFL